MSRRTTAFTTFHIAGFAMLAGCSSPPKPLDLLPLTPTVTYQRVPHARADGQALAYSVRWLAVADEPTGEAISQASSAIVRDRGEPFRGSTRMPIGSRWLDAEAVAGWQADDGRGDPLREQQLATADVVLAPGLGTLLPAAAAQLPQIELHLDKDHTGHVNAMLDVPADEGAGREVLVIEPAATADGPGALFVPTDDLRPGGLLVLFAPTGAAADDAVRDAIAIADADPAPEPPKISPRRKAWQVAREAVGARNRRPALLALVSPLQLERAVDVLTVADERALIAVTKGMTAADADADDVAWQLERGLWSSLMPRLERDELTPAMRASVTRHLGALVGDPASLSLLLETCDGREAFTRGIRDENVLALDDRSAAVRITAQTFLATRGVEVPGYQPMAARKQRRRAVRHYLQAQEEGR
ncbi:MAG: hypothetical protein ACE37K_25460 [Planctomycetota bacterium]